MAVETWDICVYYVIEVHSVIIIIINKSFSVMVLVPTIYYIKFNNVTF